MTKSRKTEMLMAMTGETDSRILSAFLSLAAEKILKKCYPFRADIREVPAKYSMTQIEIACYLLNKQGAEGEISHGENGINRSYESGSVPESMLRDVVPFVATLPVKRRNSP